MRKKILFVDDDKDFLDEITETFDEKGYETQFCTNGEKVLEKVKVFKPDLILLDIKMEGKNGFQVAYDLKRFPVSARIPVFAITGHYTKKEHQSLMEVCGILKRFKKPIYPSRILRHIEEVLRNKIPS